ncbi:hypothetical protein JM658_12725 [Joostella atrarenae]|uniref:Uncharacterized protein n=1 Tax=Joostella atrarenae TaxID=679257 RepID=A0ABS9J5I7_9FLAO|nr:hypothetical protein [Joostella atrarenae]MCF8715692.1 hypothetical protein [Joostella atrarenae]
MVLQLTSNDFQINSVSVEFPIGINQLKDILKSTCIRHKAKYNTIFTWDELGVIAHSKNGELVESIAIELTSETFKFSPKETFTGIFYFNNREITNYYETYKEEHVKLFEGDDSGALVLNNISAWFYVGENAIDAIEISEYKPYNRSDGIPKDLYTIKELNEEIIPFVDFGFKVAIIQVLMYEKGLLQPKFDLYEFVKWYPHREIDIEEEGYDQIAEVTQYFKDLQIPKRFASEVTEIYQDGGNDIYINLIRFSGGWEDEWDIISSDDMVHFPNLKKATLCYAKDAIYDEFIEMGIDTEWL